ncbi:adenine deaminase C-terminal domain-containing protein [Frankia sp. Allo2]|uniref:adenine deaminase C-terminal domain-containing protein n=1 Tax=Frankia sp. Allo2 TaxID=981405 RepID=UPI000555A1C6|nr:adenine deaminase C-terminal domain-containing protein [Frankia sp. Allo2]
MLTGRREAAMNAERSSRGPRLMTVSGGASQPTVSSATPHRSATPARTAASGTTSTTAPAVDPRDPAAAPGPTGQAPVVGADLLRPSEAQLARLRRVAAGEEEADLVIRGGLVVAVHSGAVAARDILIVGCYIAAVTKPGTLAGRRSLDAAGRFVLPAYVDAGLRVEETLLTPGELARLIVPRGTVTLVTDPAVLVALGGLRGVDLVTGSSTPLRVLVRAGQVPGRQVPGTGAPAAPVVEVPPIPPASALTALSSVGAAPVKSSATEAGGLLWAAGSGAEPVRGRARSVAELATVGHLDHDVRLAVGRGMGQIDAIRRFSLLPARRHDLEPTLGSIAPTRFADLQVVSSLAGTAPPDVVVAGGRIAAECGRPLFDNLDISPAWATSRTRLPANLHAGSFTSLGLRRSHRQDASVVVVSVDPPRDPGTAPPVGGPARALRMTGTGQVSGLSHPRGLRTVRVEPTLRDGWAVADPSRDLLKIAIFGRDGSSDEIDVGLLRGCGLTRGALAVTTAEPPGHLIVVGARDDDMVTAARALEGMGGGYVVVDQGWVRAACALPLLGVMSDAPWEAVLGELAAVDTAAADLGCRLPFPLRTLAGWGCALYTRP